MQILLEWCLHGSVQSLDQLRHLIPGHNRATRVRTNMEPCRSKSWPAFFRSETCTLSRLKIRRVPPVPCKRKVELCKFLSVQRFLRTRVNGALVCKFGTCFFSGPKLAHLGHVYTGPDKFLHGQKLARFHLAFTRDRWNWTNFWTAKAPFTGVRRNFCTDKNLYTGPAELGEYLKG